VFCPECKASYRDGFTHCPDCDVDLVDSLPAPGSDWDPLGGELTTVYTTEIESDCVGICEDFRKAGIPFKVLQHAQQFHKEVDTHFAIEVPPRFREQAEKLTKKNQVDFSDTDEDQRIMELPAEDDSESDENTDAEPRWHKKDATVEVWRGNWKEGGEMIASSLAENGIRFRASEGEDGSRRIFVRPQDESRAREIVREVTKAEPK
jgi:hypothetical protein